MVDPFRMNPTICVPQYATAVNNWTDVTARVEPKFSPSAAPTFSMNSTSAGYLPCGLTLVSYPRNGVLHRTITMLRPPSSCPKQGSIDGNSRVQGSAPVRRGPLPPSPSFERGSYDSDIAQAKPGFAMTQQLEAIYEGGVFFTRWSPCSSPCSIQTTRRMLVSSPPAGTWDQFGS